MDIIQFIKAHTPADYETIIRCIRKATIIFYDTKKVFVADETHIYFFATSKEIRCTKEFHKFYHEYYPKMKNKILFTKNIQAFRNRVMPIDEEEGMYLWL